MPAIPHDRLPDSTLAFGLDPYGFIAKRCRRFGTELFQARILLQPTICMLGRAAAELFYDETRFQRAGAPPTRLEIAADAPADTRVILDLYGTNHDPREWTEPDCCHRCPGEWITIELMKRATVLLVRNLTYEVPDQNLTINTRRLPALPRSRFIMRKIRLV
jgi:hypothetical protein